MQLDNSAKVFSTLSWFDEIDSTNLEMGRQLALGAGEFSAVIAGTQTAGQGRLGRKWQSPPGASLSLSIATFEIPHNPGWLNLLAAMAVNKVLKNLGVESGIKWPNDVLVSGKKICGILSVVDKSSAAIIGIGLNLKAQTAELSATSLEELGVEIALDDLASAIGAELKVLIRRFAEDPEQLRGEYAEASITLGESVRAQLSGGHEVIGLASEIAQSGQLVILTPERIELSAGDVWHLRS